MQQEGEIPDPFLSKQNLQLSGFPFADHFEILNDILAAFGFYRKDFPRAGKIEYELENADSFHGVA